MSDLPIGTVTFLFTDIEHSTRLLEQLGDQYAELLTDQRTILREVFERWNGQEVDTQGDSFFYSFPRASQALNAAVDAQRALASHVWPQDVDLLVRMGLHTGEPLTQGEGYIGMDVHRAARIAGAGHGGQILLSETTAPLVLDSLPEGVSMIDLGRHRLKDMKRPERITQIILDGGKSDFPPLKTLEMLPSDDQPSIHVSPPSFLSQSEQEPPPPVFVAREQEIARLMRDLDIASEGKGRVVFTTGDPGRGKTALLEAYGRLATEVYPNVLVAMGSCSAYRGVGDPYQPFRQILSMLCGDVERAWATGAVGSTNALRLWEAMPITVRAIVETAPDLLDTFVPAQSISAWARDAIGTKPAWLERLSHLDKRKEETSTERQKSTLFEQYERVLKSLCNDHTLVLMLDDLQWVDAASLDLLFHLGRCVGDHPIVIVGAYRPEEVAMGRGEGSHPLNKVIAEFKRQFGLIELNLSSPDENEGRQFVDALIDVEPNRLEAGFRKSFHEHTAGHPLFSVELLRTLKERGALALDEEGEWFEADQIDWSVLPPKVEGVIEERFNRLSRDQLATLKVASVQGTEFSAQIVAQVRNVDERFLIRQLSEDLDKQHRLIREFGISEVDHQRLYQYRFQHDLFQKHIYKHISKFERSELHKDVGESLERFYGTNSRQIAPQLAFHFSEAGVDKKAVEYLLIAGDQARMISAHKEAIDYYTRAQVFLEQLEDRELLALTLMKMGLVYTADFQAEQVKDAYAMAFEIWDKIAQPDRTLDRELPVNILRMAVARPLTFDPGKLTDDVSMFVVGQIHEGLVIIDDEYNVLPACASSWDVLDGGTRYVFHLHEDLKWSDGSALTADDFAVTWIRNLGSATQSPLSHLLHVLQNARAYSSGEISDPDSVGVRAIDPHTLEVNLQTPIAYLPFLLALPIAAPNHPDVISGQIKPDEDPRGMITNGPYYISGFIEHQNFSLQRNPNYRGRFPGNVDRVECPFIEDFNDVFEVYARGELDAVQMITANLSTMAKARDQFPEDFRIVPQLSTVYMTFRMDRPPFNDERVREAFVHAVDRRSIIRKASQGLYTPATGGFIPPGMSAHSEEIGLEFDPELARHLLDDAGYPDGEGFPHISWVYTGSKEDPLLPLLKQSFHEHLGLELEPLAMEWEGFLKRRDQDPADLALNGWFADIPDPDNFLRPTFHSTYGLNPSRWANAAYDRLVEDAARTIDHDTRIELYQKADHLLVSEAAAIMPLYYGAARSLAKPWVTMPQIPPAMLKLKEVVLKQEI